MDLININFNNFYHSDYDKYEQIYHNLASLTYNYLNLANEYDVSIILVDNDKIREMNLNYRYKDYPTDVISFENENKEVIDGIVELGDIFISVDKAIEQATTYQHPIEREMSFLFVHGLLHCLGYDHLNEEDEEAMFAIQEVILDEYQKNYRY